MSTANAASRLLALPAEIREEIYRLLLSPESNRILEEDDYIRYDYRRALNVFYLNRQVYYESRKIFRDLNVFVRIETPWGVEPMRHVEKNGHVPILVGTDKADRFMQHSLRVGIRAPQMPMLAQEDHAFVILLNDLPKFSRMWFWSDLSHSHLNSHLQLTLTIRDPHHPDYETPRVSKALQRQLILPFGEVRNLHSTLVDGEDGLKVFSSIEAELREHQARPHASPESCLRLATQRLHEGNALLVAKPPEANRALDFYRRAWHAIHVVIAGRERHIHADQYFSRELTEEPYVGKNGQAERLKIRLQLVAKTCQAYLMLHEWAQCIHWGMRSINMVRLAVSHDEQHVLSAEEEAVLAMPAADQMGRIYYFTAVALKETGDVAQSKVLLNVARLYNPRDEDVQKASEELVSRRS